MVQRIRENIYKIEVPLPKNPLKVLNSYFIRGKDSDLLIDTGFRLDACRRALSDGLEEIGWDRDRLDVMITHFHADHSGLMYEYAGENRRIYMNSICINRLAEFTSGQALRESRRLYIENGFPEALFRSNESHDPAIIYSVTYMDNRLTPFNPGETFTVGDYEIKAIDADGHTPGNLMFWIEKEKIMFTGDHVLFDITPNITAWARVPDSLGDYLKNLCLAKAYPVELALPGHRASGDYQKRIDELLAHHDVRLNEVLCIIGEEPGLNSYEISGKMRWKIRATNWDAFPTVQKVFAVGECMSHLNYLELRGKIRREKQDGIWRYYLV